MRVSSKIGLGKIKQSQIDLQFVFFRYPRDFIVEGTPYAGFDRHNGEIAAFHLDR